MINFNHSEEQTLIANSLDRLLQDTYPFAQRLKLVETSPGFSEGLWNSLSELGTTAVLVPEAFDGLGGNAEDAMVIMEQVGRHLLVAPLLASAIIGTSAVAKAASRAQMEKLLPALASGEQRTAVALSEPGHAGLPEKFATSANESGNTLLLNGHKSLLHFGQCADYLVVAAQFGDAPGLFLVNPDSDGLRLREYRTHDGGAAVDLILENTPCERLGESNNTRQIIGYLWDLGAAAVCAEALGCMDSIYQQTCDYLKIREQFGAPLASFQVLQHRLVDMHIACELSRSISCDAIWSMDNADPTIRGKAVAGAKVSIGQHGVRVGKEGVQLHGGIGMTMELPIGHYFKRLAMINRQYGDAADRLGDYQLGAGSTIEFNRPE